MARSKDPMDKLFGKDIDRFVMDTGPQEKGKYRVITDLHKMKCPRCETTYFSAAKFGPYCIDCTFIVSEEKKIGRELTKKERCRIYRFFQEHARKLKIIVGKKLRFTINL